VYSSVRRLLSSRRQKRKRRVNSLICYWSLAWKSRRVIILECVCIVERRFLIRYRVLYIPLPYNRPHYLWEKYTANLIKNRCFQVECRWKVLNKKFWFIETTLRSFNLFFFFEIPGNFIKRKTFWNLHNDIYFNIK